MNLSRKQALDSLIMKLSLLTGGIVLLFSILNGYSFMLIILRACGAFIFIYGLSEGFKKLWVSFAPPIKQEKHEGSRIDVILGSLSPDNDKETQTLEHNSEQASAPSEPLARAYGGVAGQINHHMQDGLQDMETKEEIIRRMGWDEQEGGL